MRILFKIYLWEFSLKRIQTGNTGKSYNHYNVNGVGQMLSLHGPDVLWCISIIVRYIFVLEQFMFANVKRCNVKPLLLRMSLSIHVILCPFAAVKCTVHWNQDWSLVVLVSLSTRTKVRWSLCYVIFFSCW